MSDRHHRQLVDRYTIEMPAAESVLWSDPNYEPAGSQFVIDNPAGQAVWFRH